MEPIGTPLSHTATKLMLLGAGELGKELAISAQRLGLEVIAVDRYDNAPAMQVAHRSHVISMLDGAALKQVIEAESPHFIVPELEAIATHVLVDLEQQGLTVVPCAKAVRATMDREGIRRIAAETLNLTTPDYAFADNEKQFNEAIAQVGYPAVAKPIMSSSGKGQAVIKSEADHEAAWETALSGGRAGPGKVIVEQWIDFDYELTLLTVKSQETIQFCPPIAHTQSKGDYICSWQPHPMPEATLKKAHNIAEQVVKALGGNGLFGVELFIKDDEVYFSEVSPRPHDTGMVTLISQNLSEFDLHLRAILGLPIPTIECPRPSASHAINAEGLSRMTTFTGLDQALQQPHTDLRLFGKPDVKSKRRMGVALAQADTVEDAKAKVKKMVDCVAFGHLE